MKIQIYYRAHNLEGSGKLLCIRTLDEQESLPCICRCDRLNMWHLLCRSPEPATAKYAVDSAPGAALFACQCACGSASCPAVPGTRIIVTGSIALLAFEVTEQSLG